MFKKFFNKLESVLDSARKFLLSRPMMAIYTGALVVGAFTLMVNPAALEAVKAGFNTVKVIMH